MAEMIVDITKGVYKETITRCKDCEKWTVGDFDYGICNWNGYVKQIRTTPADGFCNYGKRKENN